MSVAVNSTVRNTSNLKKVRMVAMMNDVDHPLANVPLTGNTPTQTGRTWASGDYRSAASPPV